MKSDAKLNSRRCYIYRISQAFCTEKLRRRTSKRKQCSFTQHNMTKRSRDCMDAQTMFVSADESNFRNIVQQLTGIPTANNSSAYKKAVLIEKPKPFKPVAVRPIAKKLCGNTVSWIDSLMDCFSQDISPILRTPLCGKSSLIYKSAVKDEEDFMIDFDNSFFSLD
ncbi:hypothetical protein SUGI_0816920 [Cryptomeria japonica]|uniref:calmodulin-binding protein 25-like n=1 Tax=Cryptomeria japonica TaxID=3369 RepID=UPI0024146DC7|nr:calmodulin-binding protein 25-like [Cryptomeria japonica]GLJ39940.1 hypothetical protein SUGI_0816920 [Cryptomeria japonica]